VRDHGGQAAYTVVGTSSPAPHHTAEFDIDDTVLAPTCGMLLRLVQQDA
jgi:aminobenzoyl-glutamate utilization protein A